MTKVKEQNTETIILEAAKEVFQHKGMAGARMQEIADKAGINKAMLHYYFRSKDKLFLAVFKFVVQLRAPKVLEVLTNNEHLFDKIRQFTKEYISFLQKHSFMPLFVISELNRNPDLLKEIFANKIDNQTEQCLINQINDLVAKGKIRPIKPEQLLLDIMSLCVFPVIGKPLLKNILQKDDKSYTKLIKERQTYVAEFVINAIKL